MATAISTATKIGIISNALVLCGENPLVSLSDDRYGATVGGNLFDMLYETELQSNRWRFSCTKGALSRINTTPLNEWQYVFQLPTDCLIPLGVWPYSLYEIYGNHLYSNSSTVNLEYQFKPDISAVPAYFQLLMTYLLARDMIKPITESDAAVNVMNSKYEMQRNRALFADAQSRPNRPIQDSPFTQVR